MSITTEELEVNGVLYVPKDSHPYKSTEGLECVMVRTYSAGVHWGYLVKRESTAAGIEVTLHQAGRIWYWDGAASLNQLSQDGTSKPENCKFPPKVPAIDLVAIEIIPMSKKAVVSLNSVPVWKK